MRRLALVLALPLAFGLLACQQPRVEPPTMAVFFNADSVELDTAARGVIAAAAERARTAPTLPVRVVGFTAPLPPGVSAVPGIAQERTRMVTDALVGAGVAPDRIRPESRGNVPFELMPTESRRVEIRVGT